MFTATTKNTAAHDASDHRPYWARPESTDRRMQDYVPNPKLVPTVEWTAIAPAVLAVVELTAPSSGLDAKGLLGPLAQFFAWRVRIGDTVDELPESLTEPNIARFVREVMDKNLRPGTKGNYRSWLRRCAEAVNPTGQKFRPTGLHGSDSLGPYSKTELNNWIHWANGLATPRGRDLASTLIACGCGAGLEANDLRVLRGTDVEVRPTGLVIVHVKQARRPRSIPVTSRWSEAVADAAGRAHDDYLFMPGRTPANRNVVTNALARQPRLRGEVLSASRLRTTWIVGHLNAGVSLRSLLDAAGLTSTAALDRYLPFVTTDAATTERELSR